MSDPILDAMRAAVRAELAPMLKDLAPTPKPALMTTAELARELRVCTKTIDRLRKEGLPHVLVGDNCPRYRLSAVLAWLESRTPATGAAA
jgi:hypothetical protein